MVANAVPIRPGYVYVLANPSLPGWHKIGHTYRPPHRRAAALSRTALPTAFEVEHARFFWDAPAAERAIHGLLAQSAPRRREFFSVELDVARELVQAQPAIGRLSLEFPATPVEEDLDPWETSLEGREALWAWAESDLGSADPRVVRQAWRTMEQLSARGWAEGSWRLAERMMRERPSVDQARRAAWVLDAAHVQGHPDAALRAAWLRSWEGPAAFHAWVITASRAMQVHGLDLAAWPHHQRATLEAEMTCWPNQPHRRLAGLGLGLVD